MDELHDVDPAAQRTAQRLDVNLPGRAIIQGRAPLTCVVRNMSEDGALIEFRAAIWLPARFHLEIPDLDTEAYCEICHQRSNRVGVEFVRVTVKETGESAEDAETRRTADHWDAAEATIEMEPATLDDPADFAPDASTSGPRASAEAEPQTLRRGSSIRTMVSVGQQKTVARSAAGATKSWRERLLGR